MQTQIIISLLCGFLGGILSCALIAYLFYRWMLPKALEEQSEPYKDIQICDFEIKPGMVFVTLENTGDKEADFISLSIAFKNESGNIIKISKGSISPCSQPSATPQSGNRKPTPYNPDTGTNTGGLTRGDRIKNGLKPLMIES